MPRPPLPPLHVGDEVTVIAYRYKTSRRYRARVVRYARVWLTLREVLPVGDHRAPGEWRMRRDTQTTGRGVGIDDRFVTDEQDAWEQATAAAIAFLKEQGIDVGFTSPWRNRLLELADLIHPAAEHPEG